MLIFNKRNERIERYNAQMQSDQPTTPNRDQRRIVSDTELFTKMGISGGSA